MIIEQLSTIKLRSFEQNIQINLPGIISVPTLNCTGLRHLAVAENERRGKRKFGQIALKAHIIGIYSFTRQYSGWKCVTDVIGTHHSFCYLYFVKKNHRVFLSYTQGNRAFLLRDVIAQFSAKFLTNRLSICLSTIMHYDVYL